VRLGVLSFSGGAEDAGGIKVGDHWHAAYGIYNCDTYLAPLADQRGDEFGIHTHQDYLMHMHPVSSRVTGDGANLGVFMNETGTELSDTSLSGAGIDVENGDDCGGEEGTLKLLTWENGSQAEPTVITEGFEDYAPADGSIWVLAFTADGTEVPLPPGAINLADPTAAEEGREPATATSLPAQEPVTEATVPPDASTTTIPPDDSTTTTAAP
jgi:hypothetical protein